MMAHDHGDEHHQHGSELSETQLRVRALETVLSEKGYIDPAALDAIVEYYETKVGPRNGAKVVAKAWQDPAFKEALLADATKAVGTPATLAGLATILWQSKILRSATTWSCAHCAPAIRGKSSDFRQSGINLRLIARVQSKTHGVCSPTSA